MLMWDQGSAGGPCPVPHHPCRMLLASGSRAGREPRGGESLRQLCSAYHKLSHGHCLELSAVAAWCPSIKQTGEDLSLKSGDIRLGSSDIFQSLVAAVEAEGCTGAEPAHLTCVISRSHQDAPPYPPLRGEAWARGASDRRGPRLVCDTAGLSQVSPPPQPVVPVTAVRSRLESGAAPRSPHGFLAEELPRMVPEPPGGHRPLHLPWERPLRQAGCPASPQLGELCCRSGSQDLGTEVYGAGLGVFSGDEVWRLS